MDLQLLAIVLLIFSSLLHIFLLTRNIVVGSILFIPMYLLIAGLIFWGSRSVYYLGIAIPLIDLINLLFTTSQFSRHQKIGYVIIIINLAIIIICRWLFFVHGTPLRFQLYM